LVFVVQSIHLIADKSNCFAYWKYCGSLQADHHSNLLPG
jgi:hypothetical protein